MTDNIKLLYIDLFCGAGGTSTGVEKATFHGDKCAKVIACVNHDTNAIASHAANHPDALHFTEDIRKELIAKRLLFPNRPVIEDACGSFPRGYTHIRFRYGYTKRTMLREIESITFGYGKPEWGAPEDKQVFIIKFHEYENN